MCKLWIEAEPKDFGKIRALVEELGGKVVKIYPHISYVLVRFEAAEGAEGDVALEKKENLKTVEEIIGLVRGHSAVKSVRRDMGLYLFDVGGGEQIEDMEEFEIIEPYKYLELLEMVDVLKEGKEGQGIRVGVLDSGIDKLPRFRGVSINKMGLPGGDEVGHGTAVCDILLKVAPKIEKLYVFKVVNPDGTISVERVIDSLEKLANMSVDVVNISFGGKEPDDGNNPLSREVDWLVSKKGMAIVCAVGNAGPRRGSVSYPASSRLAISVGAVDGDGMPARFSSRGPTLDGRMKPEVVAYGVNVVVEGGKKAKIGWKLGNKLVVSGTSFSSPMVAGIVAALKSAGYGSEEVKKAIYETAELFQKRGYMLRLSNRLNLIVDKIFDILGISVIFSEDRISRDAMGYGIVRAYRALKRLKEKKFKREHEGKVR